MRKSFCPTSRVGFTETVKICKCGTDPFPSGPPESVKCMDTSGSSRQTCFSQRGISLGAFRSFLPTNTRPVHWSTVAQHCSVTLRRCSTVEVRAVANCYIHHPRGRRFAPVPFLEHSPDRCSGIVRLRRDLRSCWSYCNRFSVSDVI
jgi:hypothetical protein